jgi:MFS family permease
MASPADSFETDLPARLDRLPWSRWHWRVVVALGITWTLDGLEVTIVGAVASVLGRPDALGLADHEIGLAASAYLAGAIAGALCFGHLTDELGRKRLFLASLSLYLVATLLTSVSVGFASFAFFRLLTGAGIGGEYAAINSAIDELLPARVRGRADLAINGTFWLGTALGAAASLLLLDPNVLPVAIGWRACFALGGLLAFAVALVRRHLPESPRWLLMRGRVAEAEAVVARIEADVAAETGRPLDPPTWRARIRPARSIGFRGIARVIAGRHRRRAALGLSLMIAQAFAYNAIFFTYGLVLTRFYGVAPDRVGLHLLPFAVGNLLGPILLGRFFDTIGRRPMIAATYAMSGVLLAATGWLFLHGRLTATTQSLLWSAVFFVASAAASSAYLTVSELFPVELRGMTIALFYAVGTAAGGLAAPAFFAALIATGERARVFDGYLVGAALMLGAALVAAVLGVPAERRSLEHLDELPDVRR